MDAGEYDTNTLLINNLSSIAFRIYEPVVSQSSTYTFNASDVESALRNDGHLVYMDAVRRGYWCFYLPDKEAGAANQGDGPRLDATIEVCGYHLGLVEEGAFEPVNLLKGRSPGPIPINTPSSSSSSGSALDAASARATQTLSHTLPLGGLPNDAGPEARISPGTTSTETKGYGAVPVAEMHEFFINAVLSSLSISFCRRTGSIYLTSRTVLLPPSTPWLGSADGSNPTVLSALANFRVYLTTTGTLVISLSIALVEGLVSIAQDARSSLLPAGTSVLAAPLGAFASSLSLLDRDMPERLSIQSPDARVSRFRPNVAADGLSRWRSNLSKLLQMRGMPPSMVDGCPWLNIQALRRKPYDHRADGKRSPQGGAASTFSWPSALCFRKPAAGSLSRPGGCLNPATTLGFDPLGLARSWYEASAEREETFAKRRKERDAAAAREAADLEGRTQQLSSASPLILRRTSNGGAPGPAGGGGGSSMYPTPPGGVQPPGVTPSFDGAVSSPANAVANPPTTTDMDTVMAATDQQPVANNNSNNAFSDSWDDRREPASAFLEGENIFGDLGDDVFENNELTDADFNFFDQDPAQTALDLSGLPDMGSAMDMSDDLATAAAAAAAAARPAGQPGQDHQQEENRPPSSARPASPKFAKPELRHARSTLADDGRQQTNLASFRANASLAAGIKRQPSPFDPDTVYKRVRASFRGPPRIVRPRGGAPLGRRSSVFERVDFDPLLSLANKKYQAKGQFNFSLPSLQGKKGDESRPAAASYYQGPGKKAPGLKALPSNIGTLIARITGGLEDSSLQASPSRRDDALSDADDLSLVSDQGDSSDDTDEPSSPAKSSVARKQQRLDDDNLSLAASFGDMDPGTLAADSPAYGTGELPRLSSPGTPELPVTKYFADPEPWPLQLACTDREFITIAQILTEQAAVGGRSLLRPPSARDREPARDDVLEARRSALHATRHSVQCLRSVLPASLSRASGCQLRPLLEVRDVPLLSQPTGRAQHRPSGHEIVSPVLFQIPAPHVELRRYESQLSVLPSATAFWESLGLGPSQGPKDVYAVCLSPGWEGMQDSAAAFLDRLRSVYESLKLGTLERVPWGDDSSDGFVSYEPAEQETTSCALGEAVAALAQALASLTATGKNIVVYFLYAPANPTAVVEACAAFQALFERYKRALSEQKKAVANELVLQLVPLDAVASETSLAILSPADNARLCLETYDRCTLFGGPMPAPAIVLEQALPRMIDFKLTTAPSPSLLHENSCMHVAYAQSVDERWVTAAWTDNRGSRQMTASYCLGRRHKPLSRPLADVLREIWDTTHDVIAPWHVHWRVVVAKCGPLDSAEAECWTALAQQQTDPARSSTTLTLLTVDTDPSLQLIPPVVKIPSAPPSAFSYSTPASTPQPSSIVSPEQSASNNPSTPMAAAMAASSAGPPSGAGTPGGDSLAADPDADTTLVDVTDATWGAIVSHRLNNSYSLTDLHPALQSGYLVKRGGTKPEDPPVVMEVNVIHSDGSMHPRAFEGLLKEMLGYFRALGTLARLRGVVDRETDVRPWHVAAAEKGVRTLYQLM